MIELNPQAAFLIVEGRDAGRIIPIRKSPFSIGRLQTNDLILVDEQISRNHAQVESTPNGLVLTDLQSRNGVFVDERKISRHTLKPGDKIRFGMTLLVFHADAETAREVMAASIPDAPAFAMGKPDPPLKKANEVEIEPTAIRLLSELESGPSQADRAVSQVSKLLVAQLPPKACAAQALDLFFQVFAPDRTQILWNTPKEEIAVARSRKEGKNCPVFPLPADLTKKGEEKASVLQTSSQSRMVAPLFSMTGRVGWLYAERSGSQGLFTARDIDEIRLFSSVVGGILDRAMALTDIRVLKSQIARMEKHLSPEVSRMLASKEFSIEESDIGVSERVVTILFCDIQGFTPLSEKLSAEDLAALLNGYFQRMVEVINRHHGHLNKFIGDAIMALFGAPESFGDDAVNAVTAALEMVENLKSFWKEVSEEKRFHVRIGINTGKVVAGNIGSEKKMEYTVLGDAVNIASRLEGISIPDSVTIGPETARLVKDHFKLETLPPVQVKGKKAPIQIFRVTH